MTFLLDTNVIVDLSKQRSPAIRERLTAAGLGSLAISAISLAELEYGEAKAGLPSRSLQQFHVFLGQIPVLPFGEDAVRIYGQVRADLERRGLMIGGNDLLIASTALSYNLTLVSRNQEEFARINGLRTEDWSL